MCTGLCTCMTRRGSLFPSAREDRDHSRRSTSTTRRTRRDCQRQKWPMSDRRTAKRRWARDANSKQEKRSTVEVKRIRSPHLCLIFDHRDFHAGRRTELLSNARIANGNGATFDQKANGETTDTHTTCRQGTETGTEPLIGRLRRSGSVPSGDIQSSHLLWTRFDTFHPVRHPRVYSRDSLLECDSWQSWRICEGEGHQIVPINPSSPHPLSRPFHPHFAPMSPAWTPSKVL